MTSEPNDQMGTVDDPPWAGLWLLDGAKTARNPSGVAGTIVVIQDDFKVELFHYERDLDLRLAWVKMEKTIERPDPKSNDLIIWSKNSSTAFGEYIAQIWMFGMKMDFPNVIRTGFATQEMALDAARTWRRSALHKEYDPDIWLLGEDKYYLLEKEEEDSQETDG